MLKSNTDYQVNTVDADSLARFFSTYASAYQQIEQALLMLELDNRDVSMLESIQQAVVRIRDALDKIGFKELLCLTNSMHHLVQSVIEKELAYQPQVSDIILQSIDDIKTILERIIDGDQRCVLLQRMSRICITMESIRDADGMHQDNVIKDTLLLLDPSTEVLEPSIPEETSLARLFEDTMPDEEELAAYGVEENEDFAFFKNLCEPLETRAHYWHGRSERMLRLALKMNDFAGRPVDPNQLAAAVYMHDVGMALLPLEIINSDQELNEDQREQVRQHPKIGFELLRYMKQWREAANIVLQHHERADGNGYPYGLTENEIIEGAKILAIVDAIDARTHTQNYQTLQQRPLLKAAMEIGKHSGVQFSAYWVDIFKSVFYEMRKQEKTVH